MSTNKTQRRSSDATSAEEPAELSPILVDLVTGRLLESRIKREILRAVQGLPLEGATCRFLEAMDWFFGTRRFGYLLIRQLLDRLWPDPGEFSEAFGAFCARVIQDSQRPLDDLLATGAKGDSPHKVLKLQLVPEEDPRWSTLRTSIQAYAAKQPQLDKEPLSRSLSPSLGLLLKVHARRQQAWSMNRLELSPVGKEFASCLQRGIYERLENSLIDQLQSIPEPSVEDIPLPADSHAEEYEAVSKKRELEKAARLKKAQAEHYQKQRQLLIGPKRGAVVVSLRIMQQVCPEPGVARDCCADLLLLFVWCGLLRVPSPI